MAEEIDDKVPTIIPITDLRQDAATVLRRVRGSNEPVVITQRGRAAAVMMSAEAYERSVSVLLSGRGDVRMGCGRLAWRTTSGCPVGHEGHLASFCARESAFNRDISPPSSQRPQRGDAFQVTPLGCGGKASDPFHGRHPSNLPKEWGLSLRASPPVRIRLRRTDSFGEADLRFNCNGWDEPGTLL